MKLFSVNKNSELLLRAKWVCPVVASPIENGAVLVSGGRIEEVGKFPELKIKARNFLDLGEVVLIPGLINSHAHVELSFLKQFKSELFSAGKRGFTSWVRTLVELKDKFFLQKNSENEFLSSAFDTLKKFFNQGVIALGDIANSLTILKAYEKVREAGIRFKGFLFWEQIGFGSQVSKKLKSAVEEKNRALKLSLSCHAPHTVLPEVIKGVKEICKDFGLPFSIHCAESLEELEFLKTGEGSWKEFLLSRGIDLSRFTPPGIGSVEYLSNLGVLDGNTLLVHCTFASNQDFEFIKRASAWVCVCPTSNLLLSGRLPDVEGMLKAGIPLLIGTDSVASSKSLDLWTELKVLLENCPRVSPLELFKTATLNAGRFFRLPLGYIGKGAKPPLLGIELLEDGTTRKTDIFRHLIISKKRIRYIIYEKESS